MSDQAFDPSKPFTIVGDPVGPHPEARISGANPQRAIGQTEIAFPERLSPESTREDNSLFGMPPEFAVLGGLSIGRAIGAKGLTAAGRAVAGLKATAETVTPVLKYEVTHQALRAAGVPEMLAIPAAMIVSGYRRGAKAAETATAATGEVPATTALDSVPAGSLTQAEIGQRLAAVRNGAAVQPAAPRGLPPIVAQVPPEMAAPAAAEPAIRMGPDGLLQGRPGGNPDLPNQRALNEAAMASRRAAMQATQQAAAAQADPSAAFAAKFNLPSEAERMAAQDVRYAQGKVKTPSAETAAATQGQPVGNAITLYHNSPTELAGNKPSFDAFFGDKNFVETFPNEFGSHTYQVTLPRTAKVLDIQSGTPAAREFVTKLAEAAWPDEPAAIADARAGKLTYDDLYEAWTDKDHVMAALKKVPGYDAVKFDMEYVLPKATTAKLTGRKIGPQ